MLHNKRFISTTIAPENSGLLNDYLHFHPPSPMPIRWILAILIGFPLLFFVWSQALLHRDIFTIGDIDFFVTFWLGTGLIYAAKIAFVVWVVKTNGWTLADIGISAKVESNLGRATIGYLVLALVVFFAIEFAVSQMTFDPEKLAALPGLYAETTQKRLFLLFMAFFAGVSEELTYRAFAITAFVSRGINRWLAIVMAAIPFVFQHGLKSLDQFWWFFINGLIFGVIFVVSKRLWPGVILHWLIIWTALLGVFSAAV
ncbi:CPBP family intramembrane metalloprotease [Altererythrobacter sp. BO-6]|uniref:CPBP family intramembrane glutamic endopeptidase n=1 Tax=Altererythrobacter sp. BO-6 TaxID=2604537 RepID=UPI0013E1C977|nr:type II CAAX endopeptidase family protein [Altererythrobacter sp. BO-6]QIG52783.1 CPBP family intramembrane metalloprotease [Altererythrobacter sp. BO-6]